MQCPSNTNLFICGPPLQSGHFVLNKIIQQYDLKLADDIRASHHAYFFPLRVIAKNGLSFHDKTL